MPPILKPVMVHAVQGNAPRIISVAATASVPALRTFYGSGQPTSSTLPAGNGKYNGINSGFVVSATLSGAGYSFRAGDVIATTGGGAVGTALQITVDSVTASGGILDFHVSALGVYTTYPNSLVSNLGGHGAGATFWLNLPAPDYYLDITTLTQPVLWVCTTSGTNATSIWAKVSGGGGTQQFKIQDDGGDYWTAYTWDGTNLGTTLMHVAKPYRLRCNNGPASETLRGVTYTYTYSGGVGEYTRNVSGSDGTSAAELLTPPVLPGDIIVAEPFTTNAPSTLASAVWIYAGPSYWSS